MNIGFLAGWSDEFLQFTRQERSMARPCAVPDVVLRALANRKKFLSRPLDGAFVYGAKTRFVVRAGWISV